MREVLKTFKQHNEMNYDYVEDTLSRKIYECVLKNSTIDVEPVVDTSTCGVSKRKFDNCTYNIDNIVIKKTRSQTI